jgi:hypothetical protein
MDQACVLHESSHRVLSQFVSSGIPLQLSSLIYFACRIKIDSM